jgi:hypothetical protein
MNRSFRTTAIVVTLVCLVGVTRRMHANEGSTAPAVGERLAIDLEIAPQAGSTDTFILVASVRDLASDKVLSSPKVQFKKGQSAKARSGIESSAPSGPSLEIVITASVQESGHTATCTAEVRRAGELVAFQRRTVILPLD